MTDIVQRLREGIDVWDGLAIAEDLMDEAANEIERLRAELEVAKANADRADA
jgi:hypothetical protein